MAARMWQRMLGDDISVVDHGKDIQDIFFWTLLSSKQPLGCCRKEVVLSKPAWNGQKDC